MKKRKRIISLLLTLILVFAMVGPACTTAYAGDPPEILYSEYSNWLWPGESKTVGIALSPGAYAVQLLQDAVVL